MGFKLFWDSLFRIRRGVSKFLIAALFLIFSGFLVPALFLIGWFMRVAKNVMVTKTLGDLPEWDEWGHMILDGLKLVAVVLIYFLPIMVLFPISLALGFIPVVGWISGGILSWLTYLFAVALTVFVIPALLNMIDKGSFGAAFHFKEWWENLKSNFAGYLVVYLIVAGVYALLGSDPWDRILHRDPALPGSLCGHRCCALYRHHQLRGARTGLGGGRGKTCRPNRASQEGSRQEIAEISGSPMRDLEKITLRWLGVAGIELGCPGRRIVFDPYFTRIPLRDMFFARVRSNPDLVKRHLPAADAIFITHSHFDHLLDASEAARQTGAGVLWLPQHLPHPARRGSAGEPDH